ncbi:MAG: S41 family peptidase [Candidatus Nomurabacteria bacterium]|nr:S41 family peptidase [Candidatus Nomurabacteria bacterium]
MQEFFNNKQNKIFISVAVVFFILGTYVGFYQFNKLDKTSALTNATPNENADLEPFWKVWNAIDEKYPDASKVDSEKRVLGAMAGLVESLGDPYSEFFDAEETKSFEEDIAGNFSGVGMEIDMKDGILTVVSPLKNTPAYKAGIKSGDKILKIDNTITSDLNINEAIKLIRGEKGTSVTFAIYREGEDEPLEFKVVRDTINIPTLETEKRADGIFTIKLFSFSENSTDLFRNAIKEFYKSKSDKLILDLRGNPGGYLDAAVDMASWFLPNGKPVVIEDLGNGKKQEIYRSAGYDIFNDKLKFVILIDGGSASASEILAGAMQDYDKAVLVGEQSYGKGSVQEVVEVTPNTILKITVAKWLTPNGTSIGEKGLTPDFVVEMTKEDMLNKKDPQMDKAVEILLK